MIMISFMGNYMLGWDDDRNKVKTSWIECVTCGLRSYNQNDIDNKYCGHCHMFHEDQR